MLQIEAKIYKNIRISDSTPNSVLTSTSLLLHTKLRFNINLAIVAHQTPFQHQFGYCCSRNAASPEKSRTDEPLRNSNNRVNIKHENFFTQHVTNVTFSFETSPNTKPKDKMWGDMAYYVPPFEKSEEDTSPCPPPKCVHSSSSCAWRFLSELHALFIAERLNHDTWITADGT